VIVQLNSFSFSYLNFQLVLNRVGNGANDTWPWQAFFRPVWIGEKLCMPSKNRSLFFFSQKAY